jgi:hypothetical protein
MVFTSMQKYLLASLFLIVIIGSYTGMAQTTSLPHTGYLPALLEGTDTLPSLEDFVASVKNGQRNTVVGIYVPGVLALPVGQQPNDNASYVTRNPDQVTQFNLAEKYGTIGILAHNDLAGAGFAAIQLNQTAIVIYGNGQDVYYQVAEFQKYQALSPTSTYSDFINTDGSGERLTASKLFSRIYGPGKRLVFQTCIEVNNDASWGRLFIIAYPVAKPAALPTQQSLFWLNISNLELAYH